MNNSQQNMIQSNGLTALQQKKWEEMDSEEQVQYTNSTKAKAAVMLIQASHFYEQGDYNKAKQLFVQIAENCMKIKQPDEQILKWIETSYSCLGIIYRRKEQSRKKTMNTHVKTELKRQNVLVLEYNKFSGQFEMEKEENQGISSQNKKQIFQYISKINMILFGCQNMENNHSIYIMFTSYWMPFTLAFALLIVGLILLCSKTVIPIYISGYSLEVEIQTIIIGGLLILPLLMIYMKTLQQKDNNFFEMKLGQEIKRINNDCQMRRNNLEFMMPHGRQINIWIGDSEQSEMKDQIVQVEVAQTPEEQLMDKFKGLTRQASKMSSASLNTFKY